VVVRLRPSSLYILSLVAACGDPSMDGDPVDAMPDAARVTLCTDLISAGVVAPDITPRIWRLRGEQRTQVHDTAGEARVLSPARDRLAIDLGQSLRILVIATGVTREIAYPVDLVGLDWTGGALVLAHGRSAAGDQLDLVDPETGVITPLVAADGREIRWPRLSPDGGRVGFARDLEILELPIAGGTPTRLATRPGDTSIDGFLGWSGDGVHHAYVSRGAVQFPTTGASTGGGPTSTWSPTGALMLIETSVAEDAHGGRRGVLLAVDPVTGATIEINGASSHGAYRPRNAVWTENSSAVIWNATESPDVFQHPISNAGLPETIAVGWTEPVMLLGPCP
jgi:hypothetical protein